MITYYRDRNCWKTTRTRKMKWLKLTDEYRYSEKSNAAIVILERFVIPVVRKICWHVCQWLDYSDKFDANKKHKANIKTYEFFSVWNQIRGIYLYMSRLFVLLWTKLTSDTSNLHKSIPTKVMKYQFRHNLSIFMYYLQSLWYTLPTFLQKWEKKLLWRNPWWFFACVMKHVSLLQYYVILPMSSELQV